MNTLAQHWNWDGYVKDVAYDPTNQKYYMLYGQQHNNIADHLIRYDVATDRWTRIATTEAIINNITRQYEMWQLATADFNDFYILATVHLTEGDNDTLVRGTYDAQESTTSHIKILKYTLTDDLWTTVDDAAGNAPQLGFYYSAFPPPTDTITRYPMLPDTRNTFTIKTDELIYKGKNGIHAYNITDGTKRTIKTIPTDSLRSADCYIGGTPETTFYAWIEQNEGNSILRIDNGNGDEIVNKTYDNSDNPLYKAPAHPSTGKRDSEIITISDMIHHVDELYAVLQIKAGTPTDIYNESEGYLINIKVPSGNVNPVKHYQHFTRAARSPVLHKGEIYYFEGSHYQYQPHAAKVVRAGTLQTTPSDPYPNDTGNLIRMDGDEHINFGLCWRSAFQNPNITNENNGYGRHGGTASPMLSDSKAIHFWAGYGDLTKLNEPPVNDINNWHWLQFGNNITQRIPTFRTNGKQTWDLLNTLAKLTNATISHRNGKFSFLPRRTRQTTLTADITETTPNLIVQDASRFDNTGTVLINDELITYDFLGSNELSNITCGAEGSHPAPHKKGDTVLFVDALVFNHPDKKNLAKLNFKPDFLGIYNQLTAKLTPITSTKAEVYTENADSIATNGEKPRDFNFDMLTAHERPWAEVLLNDYLTDMQQTQYEVNLELPWSPHLKLGQTLVVDQQVVAHLRWTPLRILRISHDFDGRITRITARTFTRQHRCTATPIAFNAPTQQNYTFTVNEPITPLPLPKAIGGQTPLTYDLTPLPDGLTFNETTREISGTPTAKGITTATYTARDNCDVPQTTSTRFRITIVDPLTFDGDPIPDLVFTEDCYIDYPLPPVSHGIPPITYEITGLPSSVGALSESRPSSSPPHIHGIIPAGQWCLEYIARDANNNTVAQTFDLIGDTKPHWTSFYTDDTGHGLLDGTSGELRLFDTNGNRKDSETGTFNIHLGTGNWRGVARTDTRIIFLNNAGNVRFYDDTYQPQTTEHFTLPTGDWQDIALIGGNRLGFLDRASGAVRMFTTTGTPIPTEDIEFGFCAAFRSIASDGVYLYLLIENLDTVLAYHLADTQFDDTAAIDILAGTTGWQSIRIVGDGNITVLHPKSSSLYPV